MRPSSSFSVRRTLRDYSGLLLLLAVLGAWAVVEFPRFSAARHDCLSEYQLHTDFTAEPICTTNPHRTAYEQADLLDCTRAERYVVSEYPAFCTLNRWMARSLPADAIEFGRTRVREITEGATSYPMIGIGAVVALVAFYIVYAQYGETQRHAISVGAQQQQTEALTSVVRTMGHLHKPLPAPGGGGGTSSPTVTELTGAAAKFGYDVGDDLNDDEETVYDEY